MRAVRFVRRDGPRLLLDTRDLIRLVEHGDPVPVSEFSLRLQHCNARIVLMFANVGELVPQNETTRADPARVRHLFEQIERIPHIYIRASDFTEDEFRVALGAFESDGLVRLVDPFFDHWWEAMWYLRPSIARAVEPRKYIEHLDQMSLADQVEMMIDDPRWLRFGPRHADALATVIREDRIALGTSRGSRHAFEGAVERRLRWHRLPEPRGGISEFANFIRATPTACPGWRAGFDAWEEYRCNLGSRTQASDIPDMTYIECLPYVSHATLDRAWRARCRQARDRLRDQDLFCEPFDRVYENTEAVLTALQSRGAG